MSVLAIAGIVYGSGFVVGLVIVGATGVDFFDAKADPDEGMLVFFWPLALPFLIGRAIRRRAERHRLAEEEKRKWLDAPIP